MNYNKTSKLLKKFKGLHNTLRDSGQEPSGIEKDLLLSYLKELYENVISIDAVSAEPSLPSQPVDEVITASSNGHSQQYVAPEQVTKPTQEVVVPAEQAPVVDRVAASTPSLAPLVAQAPAVQEAPAAPVVQEKMSPSSPNSPLSELFADKGVNELSDKLNKLPISDINKAMGINEKVLTINELFHGDQELFSKTMLKLNSFTSFNEAKNYLIGGVASDLRWADDGKLKKADKFIQLLRRRYS